MNRRYVIKGMGRGFDGLVVQLAPESTVTDTPALQDIHRIYNHNAIFGDRNVSFPVPPGVLYIDDRHLEEFNEAPQEYDSKNPNGKFLCETRHQRHELEVVLVQFERCLTVSVLEHERLEVKYNGAGPRGKVHTRYTQSYGERWFDTVKQLVENEVKGGDLDDLIFHLKRIKEQEGDGQEG